MNVDFSDGTRATVLCLELEVVQVVDNLRRDVDHVEDIVLGELARGGRNRVGDPEPLEHVPIAITSEPRPCLHQGKGFRRGRAQAV